MSDNVLHDQATLKVYDREQDRDRNFKLTIKDNWGFIGDSKDNNLTELYLPKGSLPLTTVKHMFKGEKYVANYEQEPKEAFTDDDGREHFWVKNNNRYLHEVKDPTLAKRFKLTDVIDQDKSIMPKETYHFENEPAVDTPVHLVNDTDNSKSGAITPTTKAALTNLKRAVRDDMVDLDVSPDSELKFAGKLPTGSLQDHSKLTLLKGAYADKINLNDSEIVFANGQITNSNFNHSQMTYAKVHDVFIDPKEPTCYLNNSTFNHTALLNFNKANASIVNHAVLNKCDLNKTTINGGNYDNDIMKDTNLWLPAHSIVAHSKLTNTRLENRRLTANDFKNEPNIKGPEPITEDSFYSNDQRTDSDTIISNSDLNNVQLLSNDRIGTTMNWTDAKNTFIKDWIISNHAAFQSDKPAKPLLIGKVYLSDNNLNFHNTAVSLNLDEYHSKEAQAGLELPPRKDYDDKNIKTNEHAAVVNANQPAMKKLTKLDHGHYVLNNGDEAFTNLTDVLGDNGGKQVSASQDATLDGPEP